MHTQSICANTHSFFNLMCCAIDATRILKTALKDGYIPHKDDLFLIHGPGGVGKSSLISMFLGKQRDLARVSTAVAEESVHVCPVRDVSTSTFTDQWEVVDIDRQARMVAHTSHHLLSKKVHKSISTGKGDEVEPSVQVVGRWAGSKNEEGEVSERSKPESKDKGAKGTIPYLDTPKPRKNVPPVMSKVMKKLSAMFKPSLTISLGPDPDNIEGIFAKIQEELHKSICGWREGYDLILYYSIRLLDSGGQPQFHEVVSIVVPAVTGIVSVFKLSESLGVHGEVVFYKNGVQGNEPYKSYLTNEQVIRHDLLTIQSVASHSGTEEIPSLAFVGTFLDKEDDCPEETPDQKDEKIQSMITEILPEQLQQSVISNSGSLRQVTFRVNTRTPSDEDYETAGRLKGALTSRSQVKSRNLPLKWCGFEVALRKMMDKLGRQILSLQECEFIGHKLRFDPPSLKACLLYLRQLHIVSFYNVLPNVVFGSCQVILDKITELVTLSLELKKGNCTTFGVDRKFHQQGILSLDILRSKACSKHYSSKHFTPEDLLKVLKSLFIVTEIGPGEYLMPCVLEVSDIYPSPPVTKGNVRSSFVLHFSKKSPMLGIYCCTISYLLTKAGWKLLKKNEEVVEVARNSTAFELPGNIPGKLTFLDPLSSYLQVVVELPQIVASKCSAALFCEIREVFSAAVQQAMQTLNYEVKTPELSFPCPEQSTECSIFPHLATVSHEFLTCSKNPSHVYCLLSPDQKMWLPTSKLFFFFYWTITSIMLSLLNLLASESDRESLMEQFTAVSSITSGEQILCH